MGSSWRKSQEGSWKLSAKLDDNIQELSWYFSLSHSDTDWLTNHKITKQSLNLPAFSDDCSQQDHSSCGISVHLCPPAADGKLLWDNPSEVGTYDASCDCYRGSSWGWRNFVKHFDLRRRNYLKNDDLIIFVDFEGQWCSISVWIRCGFIRKTSILSQCFKAARRHS